MNTRSDTTTLSLSLSIRGRVQGVGFRWSLCEQALALGLSGWVRNRRDGSVEALIQGPADSVQALVGWSRHGPPAANVASVDVRPDTSGVTLAGFEQLPTA